MDCPQCRRECGQNDKFCSECGYRLGSARTPVTELSVPGKETGESTDVSSADLSRVRRNSIDWTRPNLDLQPRTECTVTVSTAMEEEVLSNATPKTSNRKPSAPGRVEATDVKTRSVTLCWKRPVSMEGVSHEIHITYSCEGEEPRLQICAPNTTTAVLTDLRPGMEYTFNNNCSKTSSTCIQRKPCAPGRVEATEVKSRSVTLCWERPVCMEGVSHEIHITYSCEGEEPRSQICAANTTTAVLTDLRPGMEYTFNITAVLPNGICSKTSSTRIHTKPSAPERVEATDVMNRSVTLCWERPVSMEGVSHEIHITYGCEGEEPRSQICAPNTTKAVLSDLRPGMKYTFNLTAVLPNGICSKTSSTCTETRKKITMATSNQIVQVTKNLTKAEECREDTKLLMQPYANWEEYLTPAPMSIAILAELVFISSNTDFSIRKGGPEGGFKYIKYPDSFRACLMQVCNSGLRAFNDAHTNMDQIHLHTNNVPNYIKLAVKILLQDDDNLVQTMLPDQLDNIRGVADECQRLAESTEKRFTDVIELICELLETLVSAKLAYGKELEGVQKKIMRNCDITTIKILSQGLEAMGNMKDQWQKLLRFFLMVSNLIIACLGISLKDFVKTGENASNKTFKYTTRMFLKDIIYNQAFYASNIASLVNMIAGTYTDVSNKYLMDAVSKLSKLMSLDVSKPEFIRERVNMVMSCDQAEEGMRNIFKKNKQDFERKTMQRLEKIESELMAVLPPESEEKKRGRMQVVEKASKNDQDVDQYS